MLASMKSSRNSIGIEIDREYCRMAAMRLKEENEDLFSNARLEFGKQINTAAHGLVVREERAMYVARGLKRSS